MMVIIIIIIGSTAIFFTLATVSLSYSCIYDTSHWAEVSWSQARYIDTEERVQQAHSCLD
jgi:hypothetical protein